MLYLLVLNLFLDAELIRQHLSDQIILRFAVPGNLGVDELVENHA